MLYLVTGGAGSGKSEYAEKLAVQEAAVSGCRLFYVATMYPYDDAETRQRIERHRRLRAGKGFVTIEKSVDVAGVLIDINLNRSKKATDGFLENQGRTDAVVLLEDLTNLYANECYQTGGHPHGIAEPLGELAANVKALIVVSNELYSDGRKYDSETMRFLKNLAELNNQIGRYADRVYEVVAGIPIRVK